MPKQTSPGAAHEPPEKQQSISAPPLRLVAWELTRSCNLSCAHCRAAAGRGPYPGELTTEESLGLLEEIASFASPIVILTGGEPLLRPDLLEIARRGTALGLRMVLATNGTLLTQEIARELIAAGISRISISIDGKDADSHDSLRGVPGAFAGALFGIENAKREGLSFQVNTTITKRNREELSEIESFAQTAGADAHHLFLLVPTGRGAEMAADSLTAREYEAVLTDICRYETEAPYPVKVTCAPQYMRVRREMAADGGVSLASNPHGLAASTRGCLGGIAFLFISHDGKAQPCGYLEVNAGNVREKPIREIWEKAEPFRRLRDYSELVGKCGRCEYVDVCGGCRARALARFGDYLAPEPLCPYVPGRGRQG
jgi:heme b synthase